MEEQKIISSNIMIVAVFDAIWFTPNKKQKKIVADIIADTEFSSMEKANLICENLHIEKRGNRSAIYELLEMAKH